jgi:hypothetical protein
VTEICKITITEELKILMNSMSKHFMLEYEDDKVVTVTENHEEE